jgi:dTDP-4-dehydrorhamnose 3,5-epimerase
MPFSFYATDLPGVIAIETKLFKDDRGFFTETFKQSDFLKAGIRESFIQDNFSCSCYGVLRGLHYQKEPHGQAKLVMVSKGEIFDVAVDIRRGSPRYGKWTGLTLSGTNGRMLFIPVGFAHGFCVLSEEAYVTYKVTSEYKPEADRGIIWDDPNIQIAWPVEIPLLSPKDGELPQLHDADNDFVFRS